MSSFVMSPGGLVDRLYYFGDKSLQEKRRKVMKMRMMIGVSIVALAMCAGPAGAALITYEGFDYAGTDLDTQNGGSGWGGAWVGATTLSDDDTSLFYVGNPNPVVGDRVSHINATTASYRTLGTTIDLTTSDTVLYISSLISPTGDSWGPTLKISEGTDGGMHDYTHRGFMQALYGNLDVSHGGSAHEEFSIGVTGGDVIMFVSKLTGGDPVRIQTNFYKSPAAVPTSEGAWTGDITEAGNTNRDMLDTVWVYGGDGAVDEIRIGTTYADVVIPEPITLTVLGLGSVLMVLRRRR